MQSNPQKFSLRARARSFVYAFRGLRLLFVSQHNARIHLAAAALVCAAGLAAGLERAEWLWITVAIVLVLLAEAANTAVEFLADALTTEFNPLIEKAKNVAAGAVLLAAIGAAIIGACIFLPYLIAPTL